MNFLNLSYFLVTAQELNVTRAAGKLMISQQTLSNHIHRLEEECQTPLFVRTPTLKLTCAGEALAEFAKRILFLEGELKTELREIRNDERGDITIGCTRTRARLIIPQILPRFHELFPRIRFNLKIVESKNITQELSEGTIDVIICIHRAPKGSSIRTVKLCEDRFSLVVPPSIMESLFPENTAAVVEKFTKSGPDLSAFRNVDFLLSTPSRMRDLSDQILGEAGIVPNVLLETSSSDLLMRLCHSGMGVTLCYELTAKDSNAMCSAVLHTRPAYIFPVNHLTHEPTHVIIGYNQERHVNCAMKEFINTALACYGREPLKDF